MGTVTTETASSCPEASKMILPTLQDVEAAALRINSAIKHTPLQRNDYLSNKYQANILLKREDLQLVRSFKIRGALNKMLQLDMLERQRGIVCASAGNHSQGVAYACAHLKVQGTIFMPETTPLQKISQVKKYGQNAVQIFLTGRNFDEANQQANEYAVRKGALLIHPFDDFDVICGQGTTGLEILTDLPEPTDYLVTPVGGGGLASGLSTVFKARSPRTRLVGVEPQHAAALHASLLNGYNTRLETIDPFVDGAATMKIGELGFQILKHALDLSLRVHESHTCQTLIELYQEQALVAEPAGCLSIAALDKLQHDIHGKTVVCLLSGGNNDFQRFAEITRRAAEDWAT